MVLRSVSIHFSGNLTVSDRSTLSVSSHVVVHGDLITSDSAVLNLDPGARLEVHGCLIIGGTLRVTGVDPTEDDNDRERELLIAIQNPDCPPVALDLVEVVSRSDCFEASKGRITQVRTRLILVWSFKNICGVSAAMTQFTSASVCFMIIIVMMMSIIMFDGAVPLVIPNFAYYSDRELFSHASFIGIPPQISK